MNNSFSKLKVKDIMNKDVFTISLQHTWLDAARKMSAKNIHHIVVVDQNHMPVIVMSVSDFLKIALSDDKSILSRTLEELKPHHRLISVKADASLYDAANEMNNHLIESVVVIGDNGELEGIVTTKDLMNVIFFDEKFTD